jgi:SAM-dependent methyltransferase
MEKIIEWMNRNRARRLHRLLQGPGRVLEIGCGRGLLLQELSRLHHDCIGTERSPLAAARALQIPGVKIFCRPLQDCRFPAGSFDLIVLWHVLEHLDAPEEVLREIYRILKPDGFLVLEVPNLASLQARIFGKHWFHLDIPRHLYHFTIEGLSYLLMRIGFAITRTATFSLEQCPFGVLQSLLNLMCRQDNILYGILKQELRPQLGQRLLHLLLGTVCILPAGAFAVGESLLGRGAVIRLESRKLA